MKRGIITFSKADLRLAQKFIREDFNDLAQRLGSALDDSHEQVPVEVNREEVETLLDRLPPPSGQKTHPTASLRRLLQEFLYLP